MQNRCFIKCLHSSDCLNLAVVFGQQTVSFQGLFPPLYPLSLINGVRGNATVLQEVGYCSPLAWEAAIVWGFGVHHPPIISPTHFFR